MGPFYLSIYLSKIEREIILIVFPYRQNGSLTCRITIHRSENKIISWVALRKIKWKIVLILQVVLSLRLVRGYLVDFGMQNKIGCTKFNIIIISVYGKKAFISKFWQGKETSLYLYDLFWYLKRIHLG